VIDLSATPFFLRGSGYAEGTLFPWTMSDFSLMDAIECGIVKLPRVPVADNIPGQEVPMFRNLWEHIRSDMPKKGRGKAKDLDPLSIPVRLQTALEALYGHYKETFELWEKAAVRVPPCFIVVCNNRLRRSSSTISSPVSSARTMTARQTLSMVGWISSATMTITAISSLVPGHF
jgi:type III restriction enzyme